MIAPWRRSSKCSGGNCVEAAWVWTRSSDCADNACVEVAFHPASACGTGTCVEVGADGDAILVRNSQRPDDVARFDREEWRVFLEGVRAGEFRFGGES